MMICHFISRHLLQQKSELEASSTQEVQVLQSELSMCRQREAEMALAYEDLRSRVEAIDNVIEQVKYLIDDFFLDPMVGCTFQL